MNFRKVATAVALGVLATTATVSFAASEKKNVKTIEQAVAGDWRSADAKSRDVYRHPVEALSFWGSHPA